jgi:hypothetical protein
MDREFKTSPKSGRVLSLYNRGKFWYAALPNMGEERLLRLMAAYEEELCQHQLIRSIFGIL